MPKVQKHKYYAVRIGRQCRKIHYSWEECKANVSRYPGAVHKCFLSLEEAQNWIDAAPAVTASIVLESESEPPSSKPPSSHSNPVYPETIRECNQEIVDAGVPCTSNSNPALGLSQEQKMVLERVKSGKNVFFTGSAGTGKSFLLRAIISQLAHLKPHGLAITASTGIAAVNIGGMTLHSWAGLGLALEPAEKLGFKIIKNASMRHVHERWEKVRVLIIDEISMIDGELFEKLHEVACMTRRNRAPFGGIQLVLSGDFCQLPPVPNRNSIARFAFEATTWDRCVGQPVFLRKVFRQKDQIFADMLNSIRMGNLPPAIIQKFRALSRPLKYEDGIEPTELYPTRAEVESSNRTRLAQLPGVMHVYKARDIAGMDSKNQRITLEQATKQLDKLVAPAKLELKVGAQVMLIKNLQQGSLVNGSVGKVTGFSNYVEAINAGREISNADTDPSKEKPKPPPGPPDSVYPYVEFTNGSTLLCVPAMFTINNALGEVEARRDQIPLILAWALSVHKSQGQTLDRVKVNLRRTFENGQAYVALSRATRMETLEVLSFDPARVTAHPRVLSWMKSHQLGTFGEDSDCEILDDDEYF